MGGEVSDEWTGGRGTGPSKSVLVRVLSAFVLLAVGLGIYLVFQYTGGKNALIAHGCPIMNTFSMLSATHSVRPGHPVDVTARGEDLQNHHYLVTESGKTITIQDVQLGKVVCSFSAGS